MLGLIEFIFFVVVLIFVLLVTIYFYFAKSTPNFNNNLENQYMEKAFTQANNNFNNAMGLSDTQKRKRDIVFPDEIKEANKNGTSVNKKAVYISETPDVEFCNLKNDETYKSNSNDVKNTINDFNYEEFEDDDPIKEYGIFNKIKKYFK